MSIYAAIGLVTSALLGLRLQRHGMPPFLLAAALFFIIGSVLTLAAPAAVPLMFLARGLEGLGFAILAVAAPVLATTSASNRHKSLAIALFAAWIPLGQLIAMAIAHPFVGKAEWRPIWWVGIGLTVLVVTWGWRAAIQNMPRHSAAKSGGPRPLRDFSRRHQWALVLVAATFTLWSTEMFAMLTWLPQYLVESRGLGAESTILAYAIPSILILIFSIASGFLLRAGVPLAPVLAVSLALQATVWFVLPYLDSSALGLAGLIIFGVAAGISATFLFAAPALILGAGNAGGSAFGVVMTGRNFGVLLGPILLPPVLLSMGSWQGVGQVFGGVSLAGALAAVALGAMLARRDGVR